MKIIILTAIWKRHKMFKLFRKGIDILKRDIPDVEFEVVVVGSEGKVSKQTAGDYTYIEMPNQPLSHKWNAGVEYAKTVDFDYMLMMGDDDIINVSLMKEYIKYMEQGVEYIGVLDCYFFKTGSKEGKYWAGYRGSRNTGHSLGAARALSRGCIEKMKWVVWRGFDTVLDSGMQKRLDMIKPTKKLLRCSEMVDNKIDCKNGWFVIDIKSEINMTPFANWDNSYVVGGKEILIQGLDKDLAKMIYDYD